MDVKDLVTLQGAGDGTAAEEALLIEVWSAGEDLVTWRTYNRSYRVSRMQTCIKTGLFGRILRRRSARLLPPLFFFIQGPRLISFSISVVDLKLRLLHPIGHTDSLKH